MVEISWWWKRTMLTLDIRELQSRAGLFRSNFSPGPLVPRHLQSSVLRFTERSVSTKCPVLVSNDPYPCWTFLKHIISWRVEAKQVRYAHWEAIHCKHLQTKPLWKQFYLFLRTKQTWTFKSSIIFVRLDYCTFGPFWPFPAKTERSKTKLNRLFHTMSLYHWTWAKNVISCHIIASHR